jgi:hypothetical protein
VVTRQCTCGGIIRQHELTGEREAWTCNACGKYSAIQRKGETMTEKQTENSERADAHRLNVLASFAHEVQMGAIEPEDVCAKARLALERVGLLRLGDVVALGEQEIPHWREQIARTVSREDIETLVREDSASVGMPPLDERLKEHAMARVDAACAELAEAVVAQRDFCAPASDATKQALELYVVQAEAIRDLLDKHAPQATGNLQTRLAQVFAAWGAQEIVEPTRTVQCEHCLAITNDGHGCSAEGCPLGCPVAPQPKR